MFVLVTFLLAFTAVAFGAETLPRLDGRTVGGTLADIKDFPYHVSLENFETHICSGAIISSTIVITAAHCTDGYVLSSFNIRAGTSLRESGGQIVPVAKIVQHPEYDSNTIDYDIAVIFLSKALVFDSNVKSIPLPKSGNISRLGNSAVVSAWGTFSREESFTKQLQSFKVYIIGTAECKNDYYINFKPDRMICAERPSLRQGECHGDSGAPLVIKGVLVGAASWGQSCEKRKSVVYASISHLRQFIEDTTGI